MMAVHEEVLSTGISLAQARERIASADLSPVLHRLTQVDRWSKKSAVKAVELYRNFLLLKKKYGSQHQLPPSYEIDEAWHAHILHTEDYMTFCNHVFGGFLHHHPHIAHQKGDTKKLELLFERTQELYKKEFGDYLYSFRPRSIINSWIRRK